MKAMAVAPLEAAHRRCARCSKAARAMASAVTVCTVFATPAPASTSATITPFLSPDRLGARAALTLTIHYAEGQLGVPSPVRRSVVRLPAGLSLEIPSLRSCAPARLRVRGASGCPTQSALGGGRALMEVHAGSQTITEEVRMWAFLGPPQNLRPTFEILAEGHTPLEQRAVLSGTVLEDRPPYGEELVISIPPIPTLPLEPYASIVSFSLTIGASKRHQRHRANTVLVPSSCPASGFPFAAEFTYADGSGGRALASAPCPR
jgi:hypothetical protein